MTGRTVIILAGGKGTRLTELYPDLPKPLVPVAGEPFLHWLVTWFKRQGLKDFVFSLGYRGDQIESWLKSAPAMGKTNWHVFHEREPLGTGGGARACLDLCADDVLIANGDSIILTPLRPVFDAFDNPTVDGALLGVPMSDASRYGTLGIDTNGLLTGFREKRAGTGLINSGIYSFRKKVLEPFPVAKNISMEYDVIPKLIAEGKHLRVFETDTSAPFIDIGTPESVAQADDFVREHILKNS